MKIKIINKTSMNYLVKSFFSLALLLSLKVSAGLTALSDSALSDEALGQVTGQALFKIEETQSSFAGQENISFTKMTLGLKIEMNAIIDELSLGRFYREDGDFATCDYAGRFCTNDRVGVNFNAWRCNEGGANGGCGGLTFDGEGNPFSASAMVYGDFIGLDAGEKISATLGAVGDEHYISSLLFTGDPKSLEIFPSGFEYTTDTDIKLRNLTFGRIIDNNGTETIEDFIIQKPFVEFAHEDVMINGAEVRKIAGLRIGFGSSTGTQGQSIDVISGFIRPVIDVKVQAIADFVGTANFTFAPYLGGIRTAGYIDPDPSRTLVAPCVQGGLLGSTVCGKVEDAASISKASPQAQLFPLQNLVLSDSPNVWISMQNKEIKYESDIKQVNGDTIKYDYETAKAGFWFNLGALGVTRNNQNVLIPDPEGGGRYTKESLSDFTALTGVFGATQRPLHPDNYFSANPVDSTFTNAFNYDTSAYY